MQCDAGVNVIYASSRPSITTANLKNGIVNQPYNQKFTVSGTGSLTWSMGGWKTDFTNGLSINSSTGEISGSPQKAGTFKVSVSISNGSSAETRIFTLKITEQKKPEITTTSLKSGTVGKSYTDTVHASGTEPFTWVAIGLPEGLDINSSTGKISGSPKKAGSFDVKISAFNILGSDSKNLTLIIRNTPVKAPKITTSSLKSGKTDKNYSVKLKASGTTPITWDSGNLPNGFTLNSETGELSGLTSEVVNSKITFTATNSAGTYSKDLKLTIKGVNPKIITTKINNAFLNKSYSAYIEATGTSPITWTAKGLTDGLNIDSSTGKISGTPKTSGKFNIKISAANPMKSASKTFKLIVESYPEIITASLKNATINKAYSVTIKAKAINTKKFTWSAENLPDGLKINSSNGKISGKSLESGTFNVKIIAAIPNSDMSSSKSYTLEVKENNKSRYVNELLYEDSLTESKSLHSENKTQNSIIFIENRNSENLTPNEIKELEGYEIAVILPELKVIDSNQYDFEIKLDDKIQTGAKLFWFAFSDKNSEDDEIADFYNSSGEDINCVPDDKIITVSAWLNSGVIYRPVIAVQK